MKSTAEHLVDIATAVIGWAESARRRLRTQDESDVRVVVSASPDDVRRIELCAMATLDQALMLTQYPGPPDTQARYLRACADKAWAEGRRELAAELHDAARLIEGMATP